MAKTEYMKQPERRGYQWPASALTGHEMSILATWLEKTGTPISHLLRQAVVKCQEMINNTEGG